MSYKNYKNPVELDCFQACASCYRCADKGRYAKCGSCSGRVDPLRKRDPYDIDDACRCKEGFLKFRLQNGRMIIKRFATNPFKKTVKEDPITEDERDWESYLSEKREMYDDPDWDPVQFSDGTSTTNWLHKQRGY